MYIETGDGSGRSQYTKLVKLNIIPYVAYVELKSLKDYLKSLLAGAKLVSYGWTSLCVITDNGSSDRVELTRALHILDMLVIYKPDFTKRYTLKWNHEKGIVRYTLSCMYTEEYQCDFLKLYQSSSMTG